MKKAFTLVELIIALAIFAGLTGAVFYALSSGVRAWQTVAQGASRQQSENFILSRLLADIRAARQILAGSSKTTLSLLVGGDQIEYSLGSGMLKRTINNYASYLSMPDEVSNLSFLYPAEKTVEILINQSRARAGLRN